MLPADCAEAAPRDEGRGAGAGGSDAGRAADGGGGAALPRYQSKPTVGPHAGARPPRQHQLQVRPTGEILSQNMDFSPG